MNNRFVLILIFSLGMAQDCSAMDLSAEISQDMSDGAAESEISTVQSEFVDRDALMSESALDELIQRAIAIEGEDAQPDTAESAPFSAIKPHSGDNSRNFADSGRKTHSKCVASDALMSESTLNDLLLRAVEIDGENVQDEPARELFSATKLHSEDNSRNFAESGRKSMNALPNSAVSDLLKKAEGSVEDFDFTQDSGIVDQSPDHCTSCFQKTERFQDINSAERFQDFNSEEDTGIEFAVSDDKESLAATDQSFDYQLCVDNMLLKAAHEGDYEMLANCIDAGAHKEARTAAGLTAVQLAALRGHLEVVVCLIYRDVSLESTGADGDNALHHAVWNGHRQVAALLVGKGVSVNSLGKRNCRPVHYAAYRKQAKLLEFLHTEGADLTPINSKGNSPLHCAAWSGSLECIEYLLANSPFVLKLNERKWSPIHCAVRKGHKEILERLIIELVNSDQSLEAIPEFHTVMRCARMSGNDELVDYLRRLGF